MDVKERVVRVLSKRFNVSRISIKMTDDLINDFGADSIDMTELVLDIAEEFGIFLGREDMAEVKTAGDLVKKIENIRRNR
jgi:acyl carrier protein